MSKLRWAMDSGFWDLNLSTATTLDGVVRAVPDEPCFPLGAARASRALRVQQLSIMSPGFPLGLIPSYTAGPSTPKELGALALQSLLFSPSGSNWWCTLVGQFRPKKLITDIKAEVASGEELEYPGIRNIVKHFWDKALYSLGLCSQISLTPSSSLVFSTEGHGYKKGRRSKAMFFKKLSHHDVTLEAAWPELFIDKDGTYWDVPLSMSLDLSSLVSESGLRYRFGIHKNHGIPHPHTSTTNDVPPSLMPGVCAKAAFSYEKSKDIWRQKEKLKDLIVKTDNGHVLWTSYDVHLREPHAAISGTIGGKCCAWFSGGEGPKEGSGDGGIAKLPLKNRSPFSADLFGSVCFTIQHGKFRKAFNDLTRLDARLDIPSALAVITGPERLASSKFNVILQQQVAGPIVARVDSRLSLSSPSGRLPPHVEDVVYSLSYSFRLMHSGKVVCWYSPKRKEGMVELRVFEF
ncbi:protein TRIGALACTOSYLDIACYLGLYCEROL 4, chloroplastic [Amborella trichopoda]|uniref:Protein TRIGALACTOSYLDIACYLGLYCEROL 4, chloroplastic n=1 Tax=Amborella trichopoda TaxID=13333 RepID=U5DEW0_AMBTC|nr:protein TRIGALACTOSYLDIACYLGLYCEROL 4, chloroplastic [Amborella trichopoda]ERN19982.1 hypothetical protein AMTR_s00071p00143840 [Amborella trichopoda]|eukprot:XP_006858515.1 protein TRIGALACTOSYLDIACYLGLYCEROL 4, chloroplastic [Amborella trichopoda]